MATLSERVMAQTGVGGASCAADPTLETSPESSDPNPPVSLKRPREDEGNEDVDEAARATKSAMSAEDLLLARQESALAKVMSDRTLKMSEFSDLASILGRFYAAPKDIKDTPGKGQALQINGHYVNVQIGTWENPMRTDYFPIPFHKDTYAKGVTWTEEQKLQHREMRAKVLENPKEQKVTMSVLCPPDSDIEAFFLSYQNTIVAASMSNIESNYTPGCQTPSIWDIRQLMTDVGPMFNAERALSFIEKNVQPLIKSKAKVTQPCANLKLKYLKRSDEEIVEVVRAYVAEETRRVLSTLDPASDAETVSRAQEAAVAAATSAAIEALLQKRIQEKFNELTKTPEYTRKYQESFSAKEQALLRAGTDASAAALEAQQFAKSEADAAAMSVANTEVRNAGIKVPRLYTEIYMVNSFTLDENGEPTALDVTPVWWWQVPEMTSFGYVANTTIKGSYIEKGKGLVYGYTHVNELYVIPTTLFAEKKSLWGQMASNGTKVTVSQGSFGSWSTAGSSAQ